MNEQETPPSRRGAAAPRSATGTPFARLSAWFSAYPKAVLGAAAGVVVVALGAGAVVAGAAANRAPVASIASSAAAELPAARVVPAAPAAATRARTCAVDASDPAFATLSASVVKAATGEHLYARRAGEPAPSLALHKVLTAAVALHVLGPDTRLVTRVYEGSVKGSIVIVGAGDPTLSALPAGTESVYAGAPKLSDLATQTRASLDALYPGAKSDDDDDDDDDDKDDKKTKASAKPDWDITKVVVDAGLWGYGDMWDAAWPAEELTTGTQANIVPLMVDGDRQDATLATSPRSADPIGAATQAFVSALDLDTKPKIEHGAALGDRAPLAEVSSQPVSVLVQQMLQLNDHTLADALARLASKTIGSDGSAASLQQMYQSVLTEYGIPTDGLVVKDGSGLNPDTAANPEYLARVFALIVTGHERLHPIQAVLPVAGVSGSLTHRFSGDFAVVHSSFVGTGATTDAATSLGGLMTAADGTVLTVSLQSTGAISSATGLALESLVAAIHACGDNLADLDPQPPT